MVLVELKSVGEGHVHRTVTSAADAASDAGVAGVASREGLVVVGGGAGTSMASPTYHLQAEEGSSMVD